MIDKTLTFLRDLAEEEPSLKEPLDELADLYQKRLWHQMTLATERIIHHPGLRIEGTKQAVNFFDHVVAPSIHRLNPVRVARIAVSVSKTVEDSLVASESAKYGYNDIIHGNLD